MDTTTILILAFVFVFAFVMIILERLFIKSAPLRFKKKPYLFSKAEVNFYHVLLNVVNDMNLVVFPKIRLADLVEAGDFDHNKRIVEFNKIRSKHIDYVLCDSLHFSPKLAIELNDSSHNSINRIERDEFVASALNSAQLPFLQIKCHESYDLNEIRKLIEEKIG